MSTNKLQNDLNIAVILLTIRLNYLLTWYSIQQNCTGLFMYG